MLKIIIMDGNAVARNLLTSVLTNGGHEVVGDASISAANLAKLVKLKPQVVCIDVGETDSEGLAMLDSVRKELPKALIFLVSSKIDEAILQAAQQRGVHGFIVKPFNSVAVLGAIRNTIVRIAKQQKVQNGQAAGEPEPG